MNILIHSLIFSTILLVSVSNVKSIGEKMPFTWEDCGKPDRRLIVSEVKVEPNPIVLYGKTHLNISADVKLQEELDDSTTVSIKIHRVTKLFSRTLKIPIPCLDGFLGSCTMSFCKYFNDPRAHPIFCSILKKLGRECTCPLAADRYVANNVSGTLALDALPIPAALLRLGTGNYQVELHFTDKKKQPFGCFKISSHLLFKM